MTIYALVNNLIDYKGIDTEPIWTVMSPSAILQGGNPYFVPDFDFRFEARPAIAIRIGKLGKSISPRFAHRYVDGIAPASIMIASNLLEDLQEKGLPWSKAISYDRSLAVGKFTQMPIEEISKSDVCLELADDDIVTTLTCDLNPLPFGIEETISAISRDNALKTGDYIVIATGESGAVLEPGQRAILKLNGENMLRFNIR